MNNEEQNEGVGLDLDDNADHFFSMLLILRPTASLTTVCGTYQKHMMEVNHNILLWPWS